MVFAFLDRKFMHNPLYGGHHGRIFFEAQRCFLKNVYICGRKYYIKQHYA